jgi:Methionine aminopeptidase
LVKGNQENAWSLELPRFVRVEKPETSVMQSKPHAESLGYSVVRDFCGHGVGVEFHEAPQILHYGTPGTGDLIQENMVFTIEPMINMGRPESRILGDGWTAVTVDGSLSAQWEHTIHVTGEGCQVLTG